MFGLFFLNVAGGIQKCKSIHMWFFFSYGSNSDMKMSWN